MLRAAFIKDLEGFTGKAKLYRLNPPIKYEDYISEEMIECEYVVVSAANAMYSGPETYIFHSNESGEVINWSELDGSFRGGQDHEKALLGAGYEVIK